MGDDFLIQFGWITDQFEKHPIDEVFPPDTQEQAILTEFKNRWGAEDTAQLLRDLSAAYGEKAAQTVEAYIASCLRQNWAKFGEKEAHEGTELEDFLNVLWEPLREDGFTFTMHRETCTASLQVTSCPIYDLAEQTGLHDWLYHLACATDFYTTGAFCPKLGITRTKTLVQGHDCCNHHYFYTDDRETAEQ